MSASVNCQHLTEPTVLPPGEDLGCGVAVLTLLDQGNLEVGFTL